ncbi:hypothetical protein BC939DRAFT_301644 [Gamsiella multidivaricata]|uniref:uncharacterized protein n=1 Tax=Gamsiella multidivaricata TaxID=101098 RepID=UPI002220EDF2|nr:uncharacterized protein BC939DRAFT_301644 [Gamsiella multidivaricata]KAI7830187.1 hypothetical protein BC939DRAFT_301644 [Gamsiella multidivaricata]
MQANINTLYNKLPNNPIFNSPMSSSSSCASSPFSSPETGAEIDLLDMPMFFPSEQSLQPILDLGAPNDLLMQQHPYQSCASVQQPKHPQQFQFSGLAHIGLGTPPTSPPTLTFLKYTGTNNEIGTMYYGSQPQAIQNAPSPTISSCSSSLSNSPYAESPLMALSSDFDLFPMSNPVQQHTSGFPSAPVMAPSSAVQSIYSQTNVYHQMTPPMNQMDNIEREESSPVANSSLVPPSRTAPTLTCPCRTSGRTNTRNQNQGRRRKKKSRNSITVMCHRAPDLLQDHLRQRAASPGQSPW